MLLRRITEHVRAQNWLAVAIDFLIVVLGVFVATQVNNWNEVRQNIARQQVYIQRLESDFEGIHTRIDEHLKVFSEAVEGGDYFLSVITASDAEFREMTIDKDRMAQAFDRLVSNRIPPPPPATYTEMVAEGQLSSLGNPALRNRLAEYDRLLGVVLEVSRNNTDNNYQLMPILYRHFDTSTVIDDTVLSGIREDVTGFDIDAIRKDREFAVAVRLMRRNALNSLQQRRIQQKQIDEILTLIRAEAPSATGATP